MSIATNIAIGYMLFYIIGYNLIVGTLNKNQRQLKQLKWLFSSSLFVHEPCVMSDLQKQRQRSEYWPLDLLVLKEKRRKKHQIYSFDREVDVSLYLSW